MEIRGFSQFARVHKAATTKITITMSTHTRQGKVATHKKLSEEHPVPTYADTVSSF
jgi:hypothetical protein